ncbi:MAG: MlaE family ABC transporter permease [Burkholderiaceae bacterium]
MTSIDPPALNLDASDRSTVIASGTWQVQPLARPQVLTQIDAVVRALPDSGTVRWDLRNIKAMDHIGAQVLWNAWNKRFPDKLDMAEQHASFFARLQSATPLPEREQPSVKERFHDATVEATHSLQQHFSGFIALIGQLMLDIGRFVMQPQRGPWREISANIFRTGTQALGITALVGFLIGVVLSYLSAQQLQTFGADVYLVNILGMAIIRELGPLLAAILVAGRSGSSITAQIGVMRVTEELDAMLVMGLPHGFRLIMPRVLALAISMPLLVVWTDAMALLGGMAAASIELGLSPAYFLKELPDAVPVANYWIGIGKGLAFGILIALVACHFGLRIKPDTESLGQLTTTSVVTAITVVILADAVFAIVFKGVGFY